MKIEISEFGEIITGKTPSSNYPDDFGDEVLFVTPSDDFDNTFIEQTSRRLSQTGVQKLSSKLLPVESIMVTCIGSDMGKLAINLSPAITNQQINSIIVDIEKYNRRYVYYKLRDSYEMFRKVVGVSTSVPILNKTDFGALTIDVHADKTEQKKIADILTAIDEKIFLNNKINSELESMAKTIYNYWFVQFDFPNEEGKPYKASGGEMEGNEELKREIPKGWDKECLPNIADITTGNLDSNAEVSDGKYLFFTCAAEPTRTNTFEFEGDAILIAGNNASANFHVNRYCGKFNAYQRTYVVSAKEKLNLEYLYQLLRNEMLLLKAKGQGSQTKFITIDMLNNTVFSKVPEIIMLRFNELISPLYRKQMNLFSENQELITLRDFLLPLLMNGQVKVK